MSPAPPDATGPGDADLVAAVRAGRIAEFGVLRERHVAAANRLARRLCASAAEADTVVSDSFATMLDALRDGAGPDVAVRPYLLSTVRRTAGLRGSPGAGPGGDGRPA
ncbi:RNA polymerase sigma factor, partial [Saccharomonospora iraqiensis]|uniref:RNA polymerase sigma factor n=1 Tax=Saccharomonospora iraqiensis TaxID=52698 RepID=UPI00022E2065